MERNVSQVKRRKSSSIPTTFSLNDSVLFYCFLSILYTIVSEMFWIDSGGSAIPADLPMRELLYQAAVMRLSAREQELVDHCGQPEADPTSTPTAALAPLAVPKEEKKTPAPAAPASSPSSPLAPVTPLKEDKRKTAAEKPGLAAVPVSTSPPPPPGIVNQPPAPPPAVSKPPECPICGKQLPSGSSERDISRHVENCLQKSASVASPPVAVAPTTKATDLDVQSQSTTTCPICGKLFSGVSNRTINNHIDECLKNMT